MTSPIRTSSPPRRPGTPRGSTTYIRFGTTDWRSNVPEATSTDLVHWQPVADAMPTLPSWAAPSISMTWGPTAIAAGGPRAPRRVHRG